MGPATWSALVPPALASKPIELLSRDAESRSPGDCDEQPPLDEIGHALGADAE